MNLCFGAQKNANNFYVEHRKDNERKNERVNKWIEMNKQDRMPIFPRQNKLFFFYYNSKNMTWMMTMTKKMAYQAKKKHNGKLTITGNNVSVNNKIAPLPFTNKYNWDGLITENAISKTYHLVTMRNWTSFRTPYIVYYDW